MGQEHDSLEVVIQNEALFKAVYDLISPEDTMNVGNIFKVPFTKIYQCFELYKESNVLEAVSLITGKSVEEYLKCPANEAIKFMKWLEQEIEKCVQVLNSIPSVPNNDMAAAGISDLDEFGEFNIYYSITKNPADWEQIGNLPFELVFTKMKMDGVNSVIQHNYNEIIKNKK